MEENHDTWSLLAVVRECTMKASNKAPMPEPLNPPLPLPPPSPPTLTPDPAFVPIFNSTYTMDGSVLEPSFGSFLAYNNTSYSFDHELVDFCKPFLVQPSSSSTDASASGSQLIGSLPKADIGSGSASGGVLTLEPHQNLHQQRQLPAPIVDATGGVIFQQHDDQQLLLQQGSLQSRKQQIPGASPVGIHKKKKVEDRRVWKMRLEELSEDRWAWRKYGQKPIKGSPYPRNYYRCSSSKGCTARKQVERSSVEPNTYLVSYTGHHYHARPSLRNPSRVTRPPDSTTSPEEESESHTSPTSPTPTPAPDQTGSGSSSGSGEPVVEKNENEVAEEGDDDDEIELIPNSMADPDLLMGMERLMNDQKTSSGERKSGETFGNGYGYGYGYGSGYEWMMKEIGSSDPTVNFGVVAKGNGLCLGIQQKELDSSSGSGAPTTLAAAHESPTGRGRNIGIMGPLALNPSHFNYYI